MGAYRLIVLLLGLLFLPACFNGMFNGTLVNDISSGTRGPTSLSPTIRGGIFSHTIEPLTFNREPTQIRESQREARGRIHEITSGPFSSAIDVRLGKNGLGDIAKEHGMQMIYFADIERWSAFFGLWSMEVVHIYGR